MTISPRSTSLTFSTDSTAQSVRSFMCASRANFSSTTGERSKPTTTFDLPELYPSLFLVTAKRHEQVSRVVRAAVVRVSVLGTAAALMLAVFHH